MNVIYRWPGGTRVMIDKLPVINGDGPGRVIYCTCLLVDTTHGKLTVSWLFKWRVQAQWLNLKLSYVIGLKIYIKSYFIIALVINAIHWLKTVQWYWKCNTIWCKQSLHRLRYSSMSFWHSIQGAYYFPIKAGTGEVTLQLTMTTLPCQSSIEIYKKSNYIQKNALIYQYKPMGTPLH